MFLVSSLLSALRKGRPRTNGRPHRSFRPQLEMLEDRRVPSASPLDNTFSGDGFAAPPSGVSPFTDTVVQSDGKVLAVGKAAKGNSTVFAVVRYNADGGLDSGFGSGGVAKTSSSSGTGELTLQSDGKILVGGGNELFRLSASGTVDKSFGSNGKVTISSFGLNEIAIQADGKIVVAGSVSNSGTGSDWKLARYTAAGKLDTTFGNNGTVVTNVSAPGAYWNADVIFDIGIQGDGKIVVAGFGSEGQQTEDRHTYFALGRYNSNGTLDTSFDSDGIVKTAIHDGGNDEARALLLQGDGKIVAVGYSTGGSPFSKQIELARYNSDGSLDASFGNSGTVETLVDGNYGIAVDATLQADGKIVVAGWANPPGGGAYDSVVARYTIDGALDTTFNGTGTLIVPDVGTTDAVAIYPAGTADADKIVTAGNYGLARFLSGAPEIASFTANPNPVTAGSSTTLTAFDVSTSNAGGTVSKVSFYKDTNGNGQLDVGTDTLLGDGVQSGDDWSLSYTPSTAAIDTLFAQAQDSYGILGNVLALTLTVS